jgi:hypothetical protein
MLLALRDRRRSNRRRGQRKRLLVPLPELPLVLPLRPL